ncbi:MAG: putative holin [Caudoviricetes sp.]|nr:MAG: putative holin [Caudoviricetes sp.]
MSGARQPFGPHRVSHPVLWCSGWSRSSTARIVINCAKPGEVRRMIHMASEDLGLIAAAFIGALVGVFAQKDIETRKQAAIFVCSGLAIGYYITPLVLDLYSIKAELTGAVGFLLGAFGGGIMAAIYKALGNLDLLELLKNRIGGGDPK